MSKTQGNAGLIRSYSHPFMEGAEISIYECAAAGIDGGGAKYATVCEKHSTMIRYYSLVLAVKARLAPNDWCDGCREGKRHEVSHSL